MLKSSDYIRPGTAADDKKKWEKKRRRKKKKEPKKKPMSLKAVVRAADKEGVSYGQYVYKHGV